MFTYNVAKVYKKAMIEDFPVVNICGVRSPHR